MKKIISILMSSLLVMSCFASFAAPSSTNSKPQTPIVYEYIQDLSDIFDDAEEESLKARLEQLSESFGIDVFLVTVDGFDGKDKYDYTKAIYKKLNGKKDGIIFLLQMSGGKGNRDYVIETTGKLETMVNSYCREYIINTAVEYLGDDDYIKGMNVSLDLFEMFYKQAETGKPYSESNKYKSDSEKTKVLLISIVSGVIISLIIVFVMKSQLKSVRPQPAASEYVREGSFNLRDSRDVYLYSNETRTKIERDSGSSGGGASSSGSGSSGKF